MTGADGGVDLGAQPGWRWEVALSFAGAQRDYVDQVAQALKVRGVHCFYDADEEIELWGKYLAEELPAIYGEQAATVVIFVSAEYAARDWTRPERRAALGRAVRERREYVLPARFDDTPLPGLLADVSYVDLRRRPPQQFAAMIAAKLVSLGIGSSSSSSGEAGRRPPGGIPVNETDLRRLGVHAAISVPGVRDEVPPEYVPRDADAGIRAKVEAAAERGGFVLLVGGSSVGKTRSAAEAVRALLPEWWLVYPAGPDQVAALAQVPSPRTVVWLDELQDYLDGEHGLDGAVVRALLNAPDPAVIIGTLWPDRYAAYTTLPTPGGSDPHAREREVLDLADVVRITPAFSEAEQGRARAAASRDPRLRAALDAEGYGLTQTLAAAPQLVARWEDAQTASPYAWAVLTAALDAARLGARAPLSADLLRAAAPGYCSSAQQAEAPENWFEQALAYATGKLHGAAAALSPAGTGIMGKVAGYTTADYLLQHASRERHSARVPASTWDALLNHIGDPADAARLADSAERRLLYRYAIPLYRPAADAGDGNAASQLAELLAFRGDLDALRAMADAGDHLAAWRLAGLLALRGDLDALRARANASDRYAASRLAELLAGRGDLDALRARANASDGHAASRLAELLAGRGDLAELRARADADRYAAEQLAELLARRGDLDEAIQILRAQAHLGYGNAARLAELLARRGDLDEAIQILRPRADLGDEHAAEQLAELLAGRGDLDEAIQILRPRADLGYGNAARQLAELLARRGDLDEAIQILRPRANASDENATRQLVELLAVRGDLDELRARADAGDDDGLAAERLAELLAGRGDLDELRTRANAGDENAAGKLAELPAGRGDLDELRARAAAGDGSAARQLVELMTQQSQVGEAEQLRRFGLNPDGSIACP